MNTNELSIEELRSQLLSLLGTLQTNREKVPLDILKTRYKKGYGDLCQKLRCCASEYARQLTLSGIRMLMYGKEASNRKQEIDRQHHTIPNKRTKDKHYGNVHNRLWNHG